MSTDTRITRVIDEIAGIVTFNVPGFGPIKVIAEDFSAAVRNRAMLHGLNQTIGDAAALSVVTLDDGTQHRPSLSDKYTEMVKRVQQLESGEWNAVGESGERQDSVFAEALAKVLGKSVTEIKTNVIPVLSKDQAKALRADQSIALEMISIKKARIEATGTKDNSVANELLAMLKAGSVPVEASQAKKSKKSK